jgi:hypothetical protein
MDKKLTKRMFKKCYFCGCDDYALLDLHRIIPGEQGGKYVKGNVVCACGNCHRRIHAGQIVIDRWYPSTKGKILHYFIEGEERFD